MVLVFCYAKGGIIMSRIFKEVKSANSAENAKRRLLAYKEQMDSLRKEKSQVNEKKKGN
jgi:hypothetical protein